MSKTKKIILDSFFIPNKNEKKEQLAFEWQKPVYNLYCFLEKENILNKVSFNYVKRVEEAGIYIEFSFDVDEILAELKKLKIGNDFQLTAERILKKEICPCEYCGGVSLLFPMTTYRDTGNVSRRSECCLCKHRINRKVREISEYHHKSKHTTRDTISRFWFD